MDKGGEGLKIVEETTTTNMISAGLQEQPRQEQ